MTLLLFFLALLFMFLFCSAEKESGDESDTAQIAETIRSLTFSYRHIITSDPVYALKNRVDKLRWTQCFSGPIAELTDEMVDRHMTV